MDDQATAEPAVGQSVAAPVTPEPPVGSTVGAASDGSTTWLGHLWNTARTIGSDAVSAGKDVYETAKQSGGDPFKFMTDMGAKAVGAQWDQAKQSWDLAVNQHRYVEAYGHGVAAVTPVAGPILANAAQEWAESGGTDEAGDRLVGHVLGASAATMAPEAISEALPAIKATMAAREAGQAPARVTRFAVDLPVAVPPSNATPYSAVDVARATPYLAAEHASTPISTVPHLIDAADSAISQIEDKVAGYVAANPNRTLGTDPLASVRSRLAEGSRASDVQMGLGELDDLNLSPDMSLKDADAARLRLNAENKAQLKANNYDTATALMADPKFAARYWAADALRTGIYDQLADAGIDGVANLRQDEGSLIAIRNAAQRQYYNGSRQVAGTGATGPFAQLTRQVLPATGAAIGAAGGPLTAAAGDVAGRALANAVTPANLTRDALTAKAFQRLGLQAPPVYPSVPPSVAPAGLLTAPARPVAASDASFVRGVPAQPQSTGLRQLPASGQPMPGPDASFVRGVPAQTAPPNASRMLGPNDTIRLGPMPDASRVQALEARPILVRDPATGRFKRVFTTEPAAGGGSQ